MLLAMPQRTLPIREQHMSIAMATRLCESSECPGGVGRAEEEIFSYSEALTDGMILQLQRVGGTI